MTVSSRRTSTSSQDGTPRRARVSTRAVLAVGLGITLLLAAVVSAFASSHPDGLEYVAEQLGFAGAATESGTAGSPLADYATRGLGEGMLSTGLSGVLGVVVVGLVMAGLVALLRRRSPGSTAEPSQDRP